MKVTRLNNIKKTLKSESKHLSEKYDVSDLAIFGSYAFGDYTQKSDVDILVDFDKPVGLFKFMALENYLSEKLNKKVDLVSKKGLKKALKQNILNSAIYV